MAKTVKRKISFNYLFLKQEDEEFPVKEALDLLLPFIQALSRVGRKLNMNNDKFDFLDNYTVRHNDGCETLRLLFKSAKHSYRAPLLDKNTVEERENPKTMAEGEQMKTHLLIKYKDGDAILFLETGTGMLSCANIIDYLNHYLVAYNEQVNENEAIRGKFSFDMIPRDDFREVLDGMSRVTIAEVFADKQIMGSEFLNFSEPTEEVKEHIVITIKSERKKCIKEQVYDIFDKFMGNTSHIRRIRVKGKTGNYESIIDTDFIIKKEFIDAQQDEDTGEYNSVAMFEQLEILSNEY